MALESGTYINSLNANNPASTDGLGQADDHFRLIKSTITSTFPSIDAPITVTQDELNVLDGDTATPTADALVDTDGVVVNDGGTMKQVTVASFKTSMGIPQTLLDLSISDGAANTFLKTDGAGNFSFATPPVVTGLSYNTGNGVLTATRGGGLSDVSTTIPTHPTISAAGSVNNSGSTFIQDITLDGNGHVTGIGSTSIGGVGVPKAVIGARTGNAISVNNVLNGDILVCWLADLATSNSSEFIQIWDQAGFVGFNPSSTQLAGSSTALRWENTTGSTKNVYVWGGISSTGGIGRVMTFHY